ncbi:TPA: integrase arm-type DNA-binding domain-containing protein [Pseudomonas aeruginosa]|uniref:tyrosine-type recombinase/integrase n=1 Tax=Pseudomonas aeruginosa TaxID=287 RepID=UPI00136A76AD|nr:integrase arm-type DNA-binding domain-containing protein [Pseudomonas aeruginosa]MXU52369.1 integrase arm-type DNA-binding domain-containing protein [Pseudomonas aeruginosa]HBN9846905.1 integrase arm-type DNA-binding domain-containing protein [Pseudomonas aeruginosa]HBN9848101.1 integrase arm-type DNA-binding domain-containing protein [Pseudomonas aeruginosa]
MGKLTSKTVESLARDRAPGKTNDGDGLYFQVSKAGALSWIFRYKLEGKGREMGLGPYPTVTLAEARHLAADQRKVLAAGADPLAARDAAREVKREAERQAQARRITFETLATDYQRAHGANWSAKWRKGWMRKLELYAFSIIGKMPAAEIQTEHVLRVLQPIWGTKTRTADEVRGQIEQVLDAAKARRLRDGDNPARWRGHLDNLLSKIDKKKARQRQHFPAMNWRDVPGLMRKLACLDARVAVAARLMILTGARAQMVRFATWDEFDLGAGVWSLPAERMKMRKPFNVPLAVEVSKMLETLPRIEGSPYLFPGQGKSGVIHANAIRNLLHGLGHDDITRHGFRSSFRDWANECTHYPREVCELSLAHDERDQTEAAYSRSDFLEKRRLLMADWATYCISIPAKNVVPLHKIDSI